jgi:anti-sigma factor RsiW
MMDYEEEDLVLRALGEMPESQADALDEQMASDHELAARYAAIRADLAQLAHEAAPQRDDLYGRRMWAQVEPKLASHETTQSTQSTGPSRFARSPYGWAVAAGLALVAVLAFQVGRMNGPESVGVETDAEVVAAATGADPGPTPAQLVLAASVSDHLDGAERLLVQISNQDPAATDIDIEAEREWASVLLTANRLYRYAAERAGQERVVQVLDDMEPVLIQLANGEGSDASDELRGLRRSIRQRDLIFKARTTEVQL